MVSSMVPREQLASSDARVAELEARLAEHVPQSIYDELVSKVISLAEAVTGGAIPAEETKAEPQVEATAPEPAAQVIAEPRPEVVAAAEAEAAAQPEVVAPAGVAIDAQPVAETQEPAPEVEAVADGEVGVEITEPSPQVDFPAPAEPAAPDNPVPEIREVQSQLAEIHSQAQEAQGDDVITVSQPAEPEAPAVAATDAVVTTGTETVQVLESAPGASPESSAKPISTPAAEEAAAPEETTA